MMKWLVRKVLRPQWVAFNTSDTPDTAPELGLKIFGIIIGLWKGDALYYSDAVNVRPPGKREFGECLHPIYSHRGESI